jgi:hypothetical protein
MAHHVFPFLIGILLSTAWSVVLGLIEVFDSDMGLAMGYFCFAGRLNVKGNVERFSRRFFLDSREGSLRILSKIL